MTTDIKDQLRILGLRHTADTLDDVIAIATKSRWGAQQLFECGYRPKPITDSGTCRSLNA